MATEKHRRPPQVSTASHSLTPELIRAIRYREQIWDILLSLERDKRDLYHFRSIFDIRIFFDFRDIMPPEVKASYRSMLDLPGVLEWDEGGTENHMFMQRVSDLALMDGSGWAVGDPATAATNEAWLRMRCAHATRSELNKWLTIGQGEFHSSTYYGYSIGGLLNLYDFAKPRVSIGL